MTSTLPPLVQALSGAVGSALASTLTYPLDLITTRLQLDSSVKAKRRGGVDGGLRLLFFIVYGSKRKQRPGLGWRALYDGLQSDLFATVLSNFFYFYFYTFLRSTYTHGLDASILLPFLRRTLGKRQGGSNKKPHKPSLFDDLVLGFVAGVASRAISTPLNIITLRLQAERADTEDEDAEEDGSMSPTEKEEISLVPLPKTEDMGIIDVARLIYGEEGLQGFWKGFVTSALLSINPSITLAVFQAFRKAVVYSRGRRSPASRISTNLKPVEAFFVGAIANSVASIILYPLIVANKRLQSGAGTAPNSTLFGVLSDAYLGLYDPHVGITTMAQKDGFPTIKTQAGDPGAPTHHTSNRPSTRRSRRSRSGATEQLETTKGVEGLYQGLQMQILKGFFNQGVTFLVKGRIEQLVVAAYLRRVTSGFSPWIDNGICSIIVPVMPVR